VKTASRQPSTILSGYAKLVMERITDIEVKRSFLLCEDMQVIQGIDMCIDCDPEGLMDYMENAQVIAEC
jgi:hypothetical protein